MASMNFFEKHTRIFLLFYMLIGGFSFFSAGLLFYLPADSAPTNLLFPKRRQFELCYRRICSSSSVGSG